MDYFSIVGPYDAVISLGYNCTVGQQLIRTGFRRFAGPFDWVYQEHPHGLIRLLQNKFQHYWEASNLVVNGIDPHGQCYIVKDLAYQMTSLHDFQLTKNTPDNLAQYPEIKEKYARRGHRLMELMVGAGRLLFIRTEMNMVDAALLEAVLRSMVVHDFRLLVVNHAIGAPYLVQDLQWPLAYTCGLQIPTSSDIFHGNDFLWSNILAGFALSGNI